MPQIVSVRIFRESEVETDSGATVSESLVGGPYPGEVVWAAKSYARNAGTGGVETTQRRVLFLRDLKAKAEDGDIARDAAANFHARIQRVRRYYDDATGNIESLQCDIQEGTL